VLFKDKPSKSVDDIDMKPVDENEASTANASEAADDATTTGAVPRFPRKSLEPTSEVLHNFARVTPKQLAHIVFPLENRFQPVRAVAQSQTHAQSSSSSSPTTSAKKTAPGRYAGGGGVLVLVDTQPSDGEPEWVQLLAERASTAATAEPTGAGIAAAASSGPVPIPEDDMLVEPPPPFEVSDLHPLHRQCEKLIYVSHTQYPFGNDT
jgi:26S proteasome regulatory subunit N2